jgi:hypothetical protein
MPAESNDELRKPRSINPKEDIEALEGNLEQAQQRFTLSAEEIGYQLDVIRAVKPFWRDVTHEMLHGAVASGAATISYWREDAESWNKQSNQLLNRIVVASGTATSLGSNTAPIEYLHLSEPVIDSETLHRVIGQRDERTFVQTGLEKIDTNLANTYSTVWQYLNLPAFDPMRGPLFLMRQVFDHFLGKLAPDSEVISQIDFTPDEKLKEKNGKGVTRRHRIEFLAKEKIKNENSRQLLLQSTQNFLDVYEELNNAHARAKLDESKASDAVYAGSALLATWLKALDYA